jgi:AraC family transcriptional regulator, melibiose operon regulatory protein
MPAKPKTNLSSMGLQCHDGQPTVMGSFHRHNDIEINYMISGSITYQFGPNTITLPERSFSLFWAAMPHQLVDVAEDTSMFWVVVPLALFLKWELPLQLAKSVLDGRILTSRQTAIDAVLLHRWKTDVSSGDSETHQIMLLELEARLRRFARETTAAEEFAVKAVGKSSSISANKAERMSRYIAEHFNEPLRVEQIAKSVHIHPTYAMHLFRETFGVSIIDFLTQHRIAHAQQMLAVSDKSVMEIALAAGFNSVSRFYTAFNAICGKSPRAYREALRAI